MVVVRDWLAPIEAKIPQDLTPTESTELAQAILDEALSRLGVFMQGVRAYQAAPVSRQEPEKAATLLSLGTTRIIDYGPDQDGAIVFVVPSLVNRFDILDIDPEHSFLRYLAGQGLRPLVVDWGEPGEEEKNFTVADYITQRLIPLMEQVAEKMPDRSIHLLGYCMGGILALALAQLRPEKLASLLLIATPWDFAVRGVGGVPPHDSFMGRLFSMQARQWEMVLGEVGTMPSFLLQTVFTAFQPIQIFQKYMSLAVQDIQSAIGQKFVLTEDWLNNGVPLSLPVARECLRDWYEENKTAKLDWRVGDVVIDPSKVFLPTYILIPQKDRIVPPECALPVSKLIPDAKVHQPDMGHIGVMTGREAPELVWKPLTQWLWHLGQ
ncbi:MAG: alpha/beta fold hydrolase [Alphaproteobacteria bacterium]|jgi:polyhydroxyalkanoate synthase|nr:alpha/beta fold hydrolase [Alphaproteobacteria bacterium]